MSGFTSTRDRQIEENRREIALVIEHGARFVTLSGKDAKGTWQQLEIVMRQWRRIEDATSQQGPFILRATATTLNPVPLDDLLDQRASRPRKRRAPKASTSPADELPLDL